MAFVLPTLYTRGSGNLTRVRGARQCAGGKYRSGVEEKVREGPGWRRRHR